MGTEIRPRATEGKFVKFIAKSPNEPNCLPNARRTAQIDGRIINGEDWSSVVGGECKQQIRELLSHDQLGLCAYCCGRITSRAASSSKPEKGGMKVEHWISRHEDGSKSLDWPNMLGVCVGISSGPSILERHCDESRKDLTLHIDPTRQEGLSKRFQYNKLTGFMSPVSDNDPQAEADLETLKLNTPRLKDNRVSAIAVARAALIRSDDRKIVSTLKRLFRAATTPDQGKLPPYAPVVALYLAKKLRAHGQSVFLPW